MIDPVISLSRLKESVGPAHEPGAEAARNRLRQAMTQEQEAQHAPAIRPAGPRRSVFAATARFSGLRMSGALATALVAITMIANQFSPPASGNAAQVAARMRAQTDASLTLLARTAANDARARRHHEPGVRRAAPVFILPPANTVAAPEEPADQVDEPIVEPTEPTGEPTDDDGLEDEEGTPADDEEDTTPGDDPDGDANTPPPSPTSPKSPPDTDTPAGGASTAPPQGGAVTPST